MAFTYDINAKDKDKSSSKCLFVCHMLGSVISVFVSTFFVAHIYSLSINAFDYIKNVGIYYVVVYLTFLITIYFMGFVVDKTKRIGVYRVSLLFRLAVVIVMIFFGQNLVTLLPLAGFMYGFAEGSYYASYNVLKQEMVSRKTMSDFATYAMILSKIVELITPIGLGALISARSFTKAAIYVAVVSLTIFIISFFIKSQKPKGSNFDLLKYIKRLKEKNTTNEKLKSLYVAGLVYGVSTSMGALINVCIMLEFNSSFSLGSITSVISAIVLVEIFIINKFTVPGKRNVLYIVSMILPAIGSLMFVLFPSMVTVIIFNLLLGMSAIIFKTEFDIYRNGILKEVGLYSEIAEHQTVIELSLAISRIVSFALVILIGLIGSVIAFKILLILFSLSYSLILYLMLRYENKYLKEEKNCA